MIKQQEMNHTGSFLALGRIMSEGTDSASHKCKDAILYMEHLHTGDVIAIRSNPNGILFNVIPSQTAP